MNLSAASVCGHGSRSAICVIHHPATEPSPHNGNVAKIELRGKLSLRFNLRVLPFPVIWAGPGR